MRPRSRSFSTCGRPARRAAAAFGIHADGVVAELLLDGFEGAVEDFAAAEDHEDGIAHALGGAHIVSAEDDGGAAAAEVEDGGADGFGADRIEAGERLVEDEEARLGNDGGDELNLLAHALAEGLQALGGAMAEIEALQPGINFGGDAAAAAELAVEFEERADGHAAVEAALLGEVADGAGAGSGRIAEDVDGAAIGVDDVDDHPHGGGFAGAVGADEAVDGALGDSEGDVVDGGGGAEGFAHVEELDGIHGEDRITGRGAEMCFQRGDAEDAEANAEELQGFLGVVSASSAPLR